MLKIIAGGSAYGARLITDKPLSRGEVIYHITGHRITETPTYQTIQVGRATHIEELGVIAYLNHSCQPNTFIDVARLDVIAVREIAAGEELNFFYPSTEWEMDAPFICLCGASNCIHVVAGARFLPLSTLENHYLNKHIREMMIQLLNKTEAQLTQILEHVEK